MAQLALVLDIAVEDIPYGAFRAWLGRYRKANGVPQKKDIKKKALPEKASPKKERKETPDWRDFVPTPPSNIHREEPLFKRVTYSDDDNKEG